MRMDSSRCRVFYRWSPSIMVENWTPSFFLPQRSQVPRASTYLRTDHSDLGPSSGSVTTITTDSVSLYPLYGRRTEGNRFGSVFGRLHPRTLNTRRPQSGRRHITPTRSSRRLWQRWRDPEVTGNTIGVRCVPRTLHRVGLTPHEIHLKIVPYLSSYIL